MSSNERLKELHEEAIAFHKTFVEHFTSHLEEERFNKFRLYFLNMINDELSDFFNSSYRMQLVMNTMQIGLNIWTGIIKEVGVKNNIFNFFFVAACFIVVKLESPDQIKRLKNWACDHYIDINFILWAERLILNKASWDLYLNTPSETGEIIYNEFLFKLVDEKDIDSIKELIATWIQFALLENSIYKKFDQTVITFSSFYIGLSQHDNVSKTVFQSFLSFIEESKIVTLYEIQQCSNQIMSLLQVCEDTKQEDFNDLIMSPRLTRANSTYSLEEIFTQYDQCAQIKLDKEDDNSSQLLFESDSSCFISDSGNNFLSRKRKAPLPSL